MIPADVRISEQQTACYGVIKRINKKSENRFSDENAVSFIESIMIRLPVPIFYFIDGENYEVVDGNCRVNAIIDFMNNKIQLNGLEFFTDYEGMFWSDLPKNIQRRIEETPISIVFFHDYMPEKVMNSLKNRVQKNIEIDKNESEKNEKKQDEN